MIRILFAVIAIGAIAYWLFQDISGRGKQVKPESAATIETARTSRILNCKLPDGTTFYTNAASCQAADLENRVNVVPADTSETTIGKNCLQARPGSASHMFLSACQKEFHEALALEKYLARSVNPAQSQRAEEYCALISQGVNNGCMATSQTFCYLQICQQRVDQRQ